MQSEHAFVRNETFPSWWPNAIGKFLSVASPGFQLTLQDSTHVQVVAGPDDQAAVIAIAGLMRWNEATVNRAHPGGAAGTYDVFVTAAADSIVNTPDPFTDATNRAFALAILPAGSTPTIVAGTVDVYRKVGSVQWDGTKITALSQAVPVDTSDYRTVPRVTALPTVGPSGSGPLVDGQECDLVADAANGVIWRLRYNAASASTYKWEFVGGAPLRGVVDTSEVAGSGAYADLATIGPQLALPVGVGGDFDIAIGADIDTNAKSGSRVSMSYQINATAAIDADSIGVQMESTQTYGVQASVFGRRRKQALAAGASITAKYKGTVTAALIARRFMEILPVRIG